MNKDILDDFEEESKECECKNCNCKEKTFIEKMKDFGITIFFWMIMFFLFEKYIITMEGFEYRSMFYAGAMFGYLIFTIFTPIFKK